MGIAVNTFFVDQVELAKKFQGRSTPVLFVKGQSCLIETKLCAAIAEETGLDICWYESEGYAVICSSEKDAYDVESVGRKIIIQNLDTMSALFLEKGALKTPVLCEYSIIARFETDDIEGLKKWCHEIDQDLLVKIDENGLKCVLTNEPLEFISRIQAAYQKSPFPKVVNFDFFKI